MEKESNGELVFLDTLLKWNNGKDLCVVIYTLQLFIYVCVCMYVYIHIYIYIYIKITIKQ